MLLVLAVLASVSAAASAPASASASTPHTAKPFAQTGHTATATLDAPNSTDYVARHPASKLSASQAALTECRMAHPVNAGQCVLTAVNGQPVTTMREIRARANRTERPLFLWRLSAPGVQKTQAFLAGSIHVLKPGFYPLPAQFEAAFSQSAALVMEVDPEATGNHRMQQLVRQYGYLPATQTLDDVLPADLVSALQAHAATLGMARQALVGLKPAFIVQQLAVLELMTLGYRTDLGMESHFAQQRGQRPIHALETPELQLNLLLNIDTATAQALTREFLEQLDTVQAQVADMNLAWFNGDDAQIEQLVSTQSRDPHLIAHNRALLQQRNVGMAEKIAQHTRNPGVDFVIVGTAHLTGEGSLIERLRDRGFNLSRVYSHTLTHELARHPL